MNTTRLTPQILDNLDEVINTLGTEIDYLEKAIPDYPKNSAIRLSLVTRYNKLLNAHNWIADIIKTKRGMITTANTARDGTGTMVTAFTADATNGGRVEHLRFRALGTNVATVARVFINNGLTNATAANNTLYAEVTLAATTLSKVAALANQEIPNANTMPDATGFPIVLPPGYKLNICLGTTVAAGYSVTE